MGVVFSSVDVAAGLACIGLFGFALWFYKRVTDDVLQRERAIATELSKAEMYSRALLANTSDVILVLDSDGTVVYHSPVAGRYTPGLKIGTSALEVLVSEDHAAAKEMIAHSSQHPEVDVVQELRVLQPEGTYRTFDVLCSNQTAEPIIGGFVLTCHDVSDRVVIEQRLKDLAFLDPLTGLPNRAYFFERTDQAVARVACLGRPVTVMFLDVDNFKLVNDTLGHAVGDRLLIEVANRIRAGIRAEDIAARLGGDEFTILFESIPDVATATRVAARIAEAVRAPIDIAGHAVVVTASIGIAMGDPGVDTSDELLRKADLAMYQEKRQGGTLYAMCNQSMPSTAPEKLPLVAA